MPYNPNNHHRRSIRLTDYDYASPGAYFVTICVRRHECVLGNVVGGQMVANEAGQVAEAQWRDLPRHHPHVELDAFVVMPNHLHGIIMLNADRPPVGAGLGADSDVKDDSAPNLPLAADPKPAPTRKRHPLSEIVRGFKTFSARRIDVMRGTRGQPFWQRNYYERVIRNERELSAIRDYIVHNPQNWELDQEHPQHVTGPNA